MKYLLLSMSLVLVSACANQNRLSECEKWPLSAHCEDKATHVAENEDGPVDPPTSDSGGYEENEEEGQSHPKHDNNGHGNGDEGDCKGRGCSDSDNPGGKK